MIGLSKKRGGGVIHGFRATPKAIGWERNLYSVNNEDGTKDASLEVEFYSPVDSFLNDATTEIIAALKKNMVPRIGEETRKTLAHCLVIDTARRDPEHSKVVTTAANRPDFKANILDRIPERFSEIEASRIYDLLINDPQNMLEVTNKSRRFFLSGGADSLTSVPFRYIRTPPGKTFVLGNPLLVPQRTFIVPIDPCHAIVFRSEVGAPIYGIDERIVRRINTDIFNRSSRVVATTELLLKSLAGKSAPSTLTFTSETDKV